MIDKTRAIETVLEKLKKLPVGHYLNLQTYKRNRCLIIVKTGKDDLLVIENGYFNERFVVTMDKLKKLLKTLLKTEFPRSRKIRLHTMGWFSEEQALHKDWKLL